MESRHHRSVSLFAALAAVGLLDGTRMGARSAYAPPPDPNKFHSRGRVRGSEQSGREHARAKERRKDRRRKAKGYAT